MLSLQAVEDDIDNLKSKLFRTIVSSFERFYNSCPTIF